MTHPLNHFKTPFWYNLLVAIIRPLYRWRVGRRSGNLDHFEQEMTERFGPLQPAKNKQVIWFHAVSVGETNAAQPLIEHYLKRGCTVLVTNTTRTGQTRAKALFERQYFTQFQAVFLPLDQKKLIEKFLKEYQPRILLLVETELWPNLLQCVNDANISQILINARLSEKSAKGYAKFKRLTFPMLFQLSWIANQDQAGFTRFLDLGKAKNQMSVVGNVKFDITVPEPFLDQAQQLKKKWHLAQRKIIVIASTHAPEEQDILSTLKPDLENDPNLICIVVPRHPERFDAVFDITKQLNLNTRRRSLGEQIDITTQVFLADTMGELWLWYALSDVAYVGGSLNEPGGGHNILEPIALGIPTLLGKNYFNFQTIVDYFVKEDAVLVVNNAFELRTNILNLLQKGSVQQKNMVNKATQIFKANQGAVLRHIELIDRFLDKDKK